MNEIKIQILNKMFTICTIGLSTEFDSKWNKVSFIIVKLYVIIGFAARLVKSVINLLDGQFKLQFKVLIIKSV